MELNNQSRELISEIAKLDASWIKEKSPLDRVFNSDLSALLLDTKVVTLGTDLCPIQSVVIEGNDFTLTFTAIQNLDRLI